MNNNWLLLQDNIKKENAAQFDIKEKEKSMKNEFDSLFDLYYKYKRKIRLINDKNCKLIGYPIKINDNIINIKVFSDSSSLFSFSVITEYLLEFRENFEKLFILIDSLNQNEQLIISKLLVHFFFEDISQSESSSKLNNFINQLIIKEIKKSEELLYEEFICDESFISKIFIEFLYRHEVKVYIDYIFEDILRDFFRSFRYRTYFTMNKKEIKEFMSLEEKKIKKKKDNKNQSISFFPNENKNENNFVRSKSNSFYDGFEIIQSNKELKEKLIKEEFEINVKTLYNLPKFDLKYLRTLLSHEKDEIKKNIICNYLSKIPKYGENLLIYYSYMNFVLSIIKENKKQELVSYYIENYNSLKKFFDGLIMNLNKYFSNIPHIIKNTIKSIFNEIQKKYKNKNKYEIIDFVRYYFINYLIIPIFEYPEKNEILCNKLKISRYEHITLQTLKKIFKKIVKGDLFHNNKYNDTSFTVINSLIYELTYEINIFLINVIFKEEENAIFKNEFKYDKEEAYKTFSLSKKELNIFFDKYNIINIKNDKYEQMIYNRLMITDEKGDEPYENIYIFIKRNYDKSREEIIKNKEKKYYIGISKSNYIEEIKICINHVLNNVPLLSEKINEYFVNQIFSILNFKINYHNEEYKDILISNNVPLLWYSDYIVKNIEKLPEEYKKDNYKQLYNEISEEVNSNLLILNKKNLYYSINISSEIASLKKIISICKNDLKEVKELNFKIKLKRFIEKEQINICLISEGEKNNLISGGNLIVNFQPPLIINPIEKCCHPKNISMLVQNFGILGISGKLNNECHCNNINQFIQRILFFKKYIIDDIINDNLNSNNTQTNQIIDKYICYIENNINKDINKFEKYFYSKNKEKLEEKKKTFLKELRNYIIILLSKNLTISEKMKKEDEKFNLKCQTLLSITLKDLKIDPINVSEKQLELAKKYIKKMDEEKYYIKILNYFLQVIDIIVKMIQFNTGKSDSSIEDFLPIIVYLIIQSLPKNMISNLQLSKYFINQNDLNSMYGYTLANYETCINFLNNLNFNVNNNIE